MLTFEQFQTNVQEWSTARGIYEHSTALAQALKAVSEVGELADATIKNDLGALKDAIGDVAVCLVNVAVLNNVTMCDDVFVTESNAYDEYSSIGYILETLGQLVGWLASGADGLDIEVCGVMKQLISASIHYNLDFLDCCSAAWNEIKDRTGRMVAGGAFVKDE